MSYVLKVRAPRPYLAGYDAAVGSVWTADPTCAMKAWRSDLALADLMPPGHKGLTHVTGGPRRWDLDDHSLGHVGVASPRTADGLVFALVVKRPYLYGKGWPFRARLSWTDSPTDAYAADDPGALDLDALNADGAGALRLLGLDWDAVDLAQEMLAAREVKPDDSAAQVRAWMRGP